MSEPEGFLSRWSRRKQEAEQTADDPDALPRAEHAPESETEAPEAEAKSDGEPEPEFDVSSLPPIESIELAICSALFVVVP